MADLVVFLVVDFEVEAGHEVGALADKVVDGLDLEVGGGKNAGVRLEVSEGASLLGDQGSRFEGELFLEGCWGDGFDTLLGIADFVPLVVVQAVSFDDDVQGLGESVDGGGTHAVQAAGGLVGGFFKLATSVEFGHDDFESGEAGRVLVDGDAAAVVDDRNGTVVAQKNVDLLAKAGDGFVDGVVDNFFEQVVETTSVGRADVHARAFADGLETFENFDVFGLIIWH